MANILFKDKYFKILTLFFELLTQHRVAICEREKTVLDNVFNLNVVLHVTRFCIYDRALTLCDTLVVIC